MVQTKTETTKTIGACLVNKELNPKLCTVPQLGGWALIVCFKVDLANYLG